MLSLSSAGFDLIKSQSPTTDRERFPCRNTSTREDPGEETFSPFSLKVKSFSVFLLKSRKGYTAHNSEMSVSEEESLSQL